MEAEILEQYRVLVAAGGLFCFALLVVQRERSRALATLLVSMIAYFDADLWKSMAQPGKPDPASLSTPALTVLDFLGVVSAGFVLAFLFEEKMRPKEARLERAVLCSMFYTAICGTFWLLLPWQSPKLLSRATDDAPNRVTTAHWFVAAFAFSTVVLAVMLVAARRARRRQASEPWGWYVALLALFLGGYVIATQSMQKPDKAATKCTLDCTCASSDR